MDYLLFSLFVIGINLMFVNSTTDQRPLIVPLHLSLHNSIVHRQLDDLRRHLQQSHLPNARMRLYDDLLTNGYYTTHLNIGTPPQKFALIVDTGSTVTYVPCSNCQRCGKHQDPRFQPKLSSTYKSLKCNPDCNCDNDGKNCIYERRYAEMSSSSGVLAEDIISFGNDSELAPQSAVFGCEIVETGDLYSQRADGIMGLGRGRLSVVDQLVEKGSISDSFSLCYGGMDVGGGAMILGGISPPRDMVFAHSDPFRSPYYNIALEEIHVAGKPLKLSRKIFDGRHGTVLDSGTTYAYLPQQAFSAFKEAIMKEIHSLKPVVGPDPNFEDICFSGAGRDVSQLSKVFPKVDMVFSNGQKFSLSPENYLFRHTKVSGAYCLGIFKNADATTLLGGIVVRNTLVTYDRADNKIGFWKTNCSELWRRLHFSNVPPPGPTPTHAHTPANASASAPTPAHISNKSVEIPPSLAPDGLPLGAYRIGFITFEISISMKNSSTRPNFTELAVLIAHELEVDDSQVHLLNISSREDDYLVRWGIYPAESLDYISNTTALSIILHLREHHMQFPEKFGSYELVKWSTEPQVKPVGSVAQSLHIYGLYSG
ncbi:aspartic proteinase 36-like isoform X2 [Mangifera indica]|uniref:aspartic proteinase 36-like isoform X2 n=1 Tax=Mangifera indica TaxID=29780 RepID=UPI001CFB7311|nr:aspartic proteinase 36-like isoform X2 [Mangifera indica]